MSWGLRRKEFRVFVGALKVGGWSGQEGRGGQWHHQPGADPAGSWLSFQVCPHPRPKPASTLPRDSHLTLVVQRQAQLRAGALVLGCWFCSLLSGPEQMASTSLRPTCSCLDRALTVSATLMQIFPGLILSDIKPAKRMKFKTVCYLLVQLMHCRKMFKAEIPFSNVMTCEDDDKVGFAVHRPSLWGQTGLGLGEQLRARLLLLSHKALFTIWYRFCTPVPLPSWVQPHTPRAPNLV